MTDAELQEFVEFELKKALARPASQKLELDKAVFEGVDFGAAEGDSSAFVTYSNGAFEQTITLEKLKETERLLQESFGGLRGLLELPVVERPTLGAPDASSFVARYTSPLRKGQLVTLSDDGTVAGIEVQPGDKVSFDVTQETFLPWPAPPPASPPPTSYRSLDADARTRTAEWQEDVRKRFERRVGAALAGNPATQ